MKVVWRRRANADLEGQIDFVALHNPRAALALRDRVLEAISTLTAFPGLGRTTDVAGVREFPIPRTRLIVVYAIGDRSIRILRIFHGAQAR